MLAIPIGPTRDLLDGLAAAAGKARRTIARIGTARRGLREIGPQALVDHAHDVGVRSRAAERDHGAVAIVNADVVANVAGDRAHFQAGDLAAEGPPARAPELERRETLRPVHAVMHEHARRRQRRRQLDPDRDRREDALLGLALLDRHVQQCWLARCGLLRQRNAERREYERERGARHRLHGASLRSMMRNSTRRFFSRPDSSSLSAIGMPAP
jgi:hypothetical protein